MRRQFDSTLQESKLIKLFKTLPDHVFFDIKKPLNRHYKTPLRLNYINPTRKHWADDFFDLRHLEEWRLNRNTKRDLKQDITHFRRY